jgi:hypothetical protein
MMALNMLLFLLAGALAVSAIAPIGVDPGQNVTDHTLQNSCNTFARDSDMDNSGLTQRVKSYCTNYFGHTAGVHVNADGYPYKMCLIAKQARWTGLTPQAATRVVAKDSFTNRAGSNVRHTFTLSGTTSQSCTVSTTSTVALSSTVSYEVNIPTVFKSSFSLTTSFSSSTTTSHKADNSVSYSSVTDITAAPGCTYTAQLNTNLNLYSSHFDVPLCLSGYARCSFDKAIPDPKNPAGGNHYYWYMNLANIGMASAGCFTQHGGLGSSISLNSTTKVSKRC